MARKILIVDDDTSIRTALETHLRSAGYQPLCAGGAAEGLRLLYGEHPELVLLDVMMPGMDGWEMAARIRELSDVPLVIISGKDSEDDKLRGFRLGADDYITKPFSLAELSARVEAVLVRAAKSARPRERRQHIFGDLRVDFDQHRVMRGEQVIDLTPTEFRLLQVLIEQGGRAIPEEKLHEAVWGALKAPGKKKK